MRIRALWPYLAGVLSGVVFIVACGDDITAPDARADAPISACSDCEKPITRDRIYYVRSRAIDLIGERVYVHAECNSGDLLIGGGCWIYSPNARQFDDNYAYVHPLISQGLIPATPAGNETDQDDSYACIYANKEMHQDIIAVATAHCFKTEP